MEFSEGIQLDGKPAVISDCLRSKLPQFFVDLGYKVGAEIGVYKGEFIEKFCKVGLKMYAIDPWLGFGGQGRTQYNQERQDFLYNHACRLLGQYGDLATVIRKKSVDALDDIPDGSLDFVYIDGNHEFPFVAQDIYEWTFKVRKGGIIAGHDYFNTPPHARNTLVHCKAAVDAYIELYQIEKFWLYGALPRQYRDNKDDRYWSWMFYKPDIM
jgi:hypothetical protein